VTNVDEPEESYGPESHEGADRVMHEENHHKKVWLAAAEIWSRGLPFNLQGTGQQD
jgi:hypothetical protein